MGRTVADRRWLGVGPGGLPVVEVSIGGGGVQWWWWRSDGGGDVATPVAACTLLPRYVQVCGHSVIDQHCDWNATTLYSQHGFNVHGICMD